MKTFVPITCAAALFAAASLTAHARSWVNVYDPAHGGKLTP